MEIVEFKNIHNIIIAFLKEKNSSDLETIGFWYFKFLISDKDKLSVHVPYYSQEFTRITFNYLRVFTFVFNLLKKEKLSKFNGTCLFDIFNYSDNEKIDELTLDFSNQKENLVLWGEDTLTKLDTFLPVFNKEEIIQFNNSTTVKNTFELFKSFRNSGVFDFPLLIKLDETILTFNNIEDVENEFITEKQLLVENTIDDDSAIEIEEQLLDKKFNNSILIKFPYCKKPHTYFTEVARRKFNLVFNNRFAYNDISESDFILLKDETNLNSNLKYHVVNTNHSKEFYDLFKYFKEQWVQLELNKFTTPFPKYWMLFLNPSLSKEEWLEQFKIDFPAVAEKPIIRTVEQIIEELIELRWIEKVVNDSTEILFPQLKSNRKRRLEFVFNNFKNYVSSFNSNIEFIDSIDFDNVEKTIVLDSFNIIDLVNKSQSNSKNQINIVVPDFLYFGYQPWIRFHLFNYQFTPLLSGIRTELDNNYSVNKVELEKSKIETINEIKSDLKNYRNKYKEEIEEEIEEEKPDLEDLEFSNDEEIETYNSEINHVVNYIVINENLNKELIISSTDKVLLYKDSLFYVKAGSLKVGDVMIRDSDISELYNSNKLYDKLVNIPQDVLLYQKQLQKKENIYQILKRKGISYQHQNYFDTYYALEKYDEKTFRIPRRKKDWAIICEYLNINHTDQQLAFIAYYGRSKQNDLKKMYKSIIEMLLLNNWIGTIDNPEIIKLVSEIVLQYNSIFNTSDSTETSEISESIIAAIVSQLTFTEIKTIRYE